MTRRDWLTSSAALAAASQSASAAAKNIVISSANGLACCAKAMEMVKGGSDTLDAVVAGVNIVELDPNDQAALDGLVEVSRVAPQ